MSNLAGRAKSWAYGKRLSDPNCFYSYEDFKAELKAAFEPPQSEFRARAEFLKLRQGRFDLHSYAQRARFLVSSIVDEPIDVPTQVVTFMTGLNDGPIRNQLFREYPKTLDEAISRAMQEEFSIKQAKFQGFPSRPPRQANVAHDGPEPMDISYISTPGNGRPHNDGKCFRCGKSGHFARNCKVSLPDRQTTQGSRSNNYGRGRAGPPTGLEKRTVFVDTQDSGPNVHDAHAVSTRENSVSQTSSLIVLKVQVDGIATPLRALVDTGASNNFVRNEVIVRHKVPMPDANEDKTMVIRLANGSTVKMPKRVVRLAMKCEDFRGEDEFILLDLDDKFDLILGMPWLKRYQPCNRTLPSYAARAKHGSGFERVVATLRRTKSWSVFFGRGTANTRANLSEKHRNITSVNAHVMATNKSVREKIARSVSGPAEGLVQRLQKLGAEKREAASAKQRAAAAVTSATEDVSMSDDESTQSKTAPDGVSELQFGDLPVIKPMSRASDADDDTAVDYQEYSPEEGEEEEGITVRRDSIDEWVEYEELRYGSGSPELHELERNPSADVSIYRTEEENDVAKTVNEREKGEVIITNNETGLEPPPKGSVHFSLPIMPPPKEWPTAKTPANLLARARVPLERYDSEFARWREADLRGRDGALRVHPIPVILYEGETEDQYETAFLASRTGVKRFGAARTLATDPGAQRSQRMQFAVQRVQKYREATKSDDRARTSLGINKRQMDESHSPSTHAQKRRPCRERPRGGAQQAPMSSATNRTHATSQGSGCSPCAAAHAAGARYGSGAVPAYQSAGPVAPYRASASVVAPDAMVQMVHANASSLGALQQDVRALRQRYLDETSLLKQRVTALETELKEARQMLEEYHVRGKHFHARYAPRVKTLWERHNALVSRWAASEPPDETDVLPHWDKNPQ
ncbi:putative retroelement, partial [Globisporangium splendens]